MQKTNCRVTIRDVAARAGVSVSTVHLVMAGKQGPKEETRQRVLQVAKELNYHINTAAAALKRGAVRIAVVLPAQRGGSRLYYGPIWDGVRSYCKSAWNFNIQLEEMPYFNEGSVTVTSESVDALEDVEGLSGALILADITPDACKRLRRMSSRGFPIVLVNGDVPETGRVCCVQAENYLLGRMMGEALLRTMSPGGELLVCAGELPTAANADSVRGLEDYVRERDAGHRIEKIYYGYSKQEITRLHDRLLATLRGNDGISGCCSVTAQGSVLLAAALRETGLAGKVAAIGSDVFPENVAALRENVFLALMYKNPRRQGWVAAEQLFQHILRVQGSAETVNIKSEIVLQSAVSMYE